MVTAMALRAEQPPNKPNARQNFVKIDSPVVALTHVRVIDGTGAPPRDGSDDRHSRRPDRVDRRTRRRHRFRRAPRSSTSPASP